MRINKPGRLALLCILASISWAMVCDAAGNGSGFVEYQGKTYFWGFTAANFEETGLMGNYAPIDGIETRLLSIDADDPAAVPEEVLTADGTGKIGIRDDRLYYESGSGIKSILLDGTDPKLCSADSWIAGALDDEGILVLAGFNEESGQYINVLNMSTGEELTLVDNGSFILAEDGLIFYYTNPDKQTINVNCFEAATNTTANLGTISQTLWDENEISVMSETSVSCAQVADGYLYIVYGSYAGSGGFLQGGEIARFPIDTQSSSAGAEHLYGEKDHSAGENLYVQVVDGEHIVYFNENNFESSAPSAMSLRVPGGEAVAASMDVYPKGIPYASGESMCRHPDLSGSTEVLVVPEDYSTIDFTDAISDNDNEGPLITVENINVINDWVYFTVPKSLYDEAASIGWRTGYRFQEGGIFRKNLKTGTVQQLHRY